MSKPLPPLTPISLAILLVLAEEPLHGYAILKALEERHGPRLVSGAGSLYAALDRMTATGLLSARPDHEDARRRNRYAITRYGRELARVELQRMSALVAEGRRHQLLPEGS